MLAELVDHVIGIDPDRDWITAGIVEAKTTRLVETARFSADLAVTLDALLEHATPVLGRTLARPAEIDESQSQG